MTTTYIPTSQAAQAPDSIFWLEKESQPGRTTLQDITGALNEYERNYHAGTISKAEMMTLHRAYPDSPTYAEAAGKLQKMDMVEPLVIGGPASVELIDREGHLITAGALGRAFQKFMANERTRNVMVLHSDVQVGWALPAYISKGGQIYKSGVDDKGLFFICELRNDTAIAKKVAEQINDGLLKSYSIAGSATKVQNMKKGMTPYMQVDEMELAEVTVCEKGVNQAANFDILKAELPQTGKIDKDQCGYRDATAPEMQIGINCGHCKYFNAEQKTCDVVVGDIQPGDYCRLFEATEDQEKPHVAVHRKIVIMRSEDNGKINFQKSFLNWMEKESKDPLKGKSFTTLENLAGREAEHHRLLQEYGFPSEPILETMRYIPVVETETDDDGKPIHLIPPWVVNESGQDLGDKLDNDETVTFNKSIDIFERIIQKAAAAPPKRIGKIEGQGLEPLPQGRGGKPWSETGPGMGVSEPGMATDAATYSLKNPAGNRPVQTAQGQRNESPIGAGQADLMRDYPNNPPLPTSGPSAPWYPSGEQSTRASSADAAPFPARSPSGMRARQAAEPGRRRQEAYREAAQQAEASRNRESSQIRGRNEPGKGIWGKVKNIFSRPRQQEEGGSEDIGRAANATLRDREAQTKAKAQQRVLDRRDELQRTGGVQESLGGGQYHSTPEGEGLYEFKPAARGRQAGTPVEQQGRGRQPLEGPAIRYRRGEDAPGKNPLQVYRQEGARNRADAAREAREERTGRKDPTPEGIVGAWQSQRRRDRMENLSPREKMHQGMKRMFRGGRQAGREVDQNLQDLRGEVQGVPGEMGRGFRDDSYSGEQGAEWANRAARGIGRGARRGAEAAGGAFRAFRNPDENVRPDFPAEQPGVRGERGRFRSPLPQRPDERLGAGSRERGGQVGRMARQWLDRGKERAGKIGGEIARGVSSGVDDIENLREYYRPGGVRSQGGLRQQPAKSYGRAAEMERRQGVGQGVQFHPDEHRDMSSSERHDNVRSKLDHIQDGGKLSPRDWMGVIHHLSQNDDGDRLANFTDMNFHPDEWHQPIGMAEMREHLGNKVRAHHGRHGGSGAQALRQIVDTLHNSNDNGHFIDLKRLQGEPEQSERGLMGRGQQGGNAWEEAFGPTSPRQAPPRQARPRGQFGRRGGRNRAAARQQRGAARQARNREQPMYYSVENAVPVHKIFAKAFSLSVRS